MCKIGICSRNKRVQRDGFIYLFTLNTLFLLLLIDFNEICLYDMLNTSNS